MVGGVVWIVSSSRARLVPAAACLSPSSRPPAWWAKRNENRAVDHSELISSAGSGDVAAARCGGGRGRRGGAWRWARAMGRRDCGRWLRSKAEKRNPVCCGRARLFECSRPRVGRWLAAATLLMHGAALGLCHRDARWLQCAAQIAAPLARVRRHSRCQTLRPSQAAGARSSAAAPSGVGGAFRRARAPLAQQRQATPSMRRPGTLQERPPALHLAVLCLCLSGSHASYARLRLACLGAKRPSQAPELCRRSRVSARFETLGTALFYGQPARSRAHVSAQQITALSRESASALILERGEGRGSGSGAGTAKTRRERQAPRGRSVRKRLVPSLHVQIRDETVQG